MIVGEGATQDRDPEKIAATGGGGRALARRDMGAGKREGVGPVRPRGSEERVRSGDRGREELGVGRWGRPARALVGCAWPAGVGCAWRWLGRLAWLALEAFFGIRENKKKI